MFQEAGSDGTLLWALLPLGFWLGLALASASTGDQEKGVEYFRTFIPQDAPLQNLHGLKQRVPSPQSTLSTQLPFTLVDFFPLDFGNRSFPSPLETSLFLATEHYPISLGFPMH